VTRNVFVLGLDGFNLAKLRSLDIGEPCDFHGLLTPEEILDAEEFPISSMVERATAQMHAFPGTVDAVVGYMDFPVSTMLPLLKAPFGLPGLTMTSLLKCEHKYWSRLMQREVVGAHVPEFVAFDPFGPDPAGQIGLEPPYWVKPVKSAGSWLGFYVGNQADLDHAVAVIREHIGRFADPFNELLDTVELPPEVASVDGSYCLAEAIIGGWQCTLEGSVVGGHFDVHGVVDSVRLPGSTSFERYQYPSRLPQAKLDEMSRITQEVLEHVGFDGAAFNIEFFWDEERDHLWLLEVNTRIAQHHSDLFEKVDGASNHQVMLEVNLGRRPRMPHGQGPFGCAAVFFMRHTEDALVTAVPSEEEIAELAAAIPGLEVQLHVQPGQRLSELVDQDSYSYELGIVYLGARDEAELLDRYEACRERLHFTLEPVQGRT